MIFNRFDLTIGVFGALLGLSVWRSLRRAHIRIEHSTSWIAVSAGIVWSAIWPRPLFTAATFLGIGKETSVLLFGMILFSFLTYRVSLVVSQLKDNNTVLAQRVALLEYELKNLSGAEAVSAGERR